MCINEIIWSAIVNIIVGPGYITQVEITAYSTYFDKLRFSLEQKFLSIASHFRRGNCYLTTSKTKYYFYSMTPNSINQT